MSSVKLPPELERFAAGAVASGRYRDLDEVLAAGVRLLQRQEEARAAFVASLEEAEAESERNGFCTLDEIDAEMRDIIDEERRAKAAS
jgi:putative addiction module CopG family antidote